MSFESLDTLCMVFNEKNVINLDHKKYALIGGGMKEMVLMDQYDL